jgi:hypothetical protein
MFSARDNAVDEAGSDPAYGPARDKMRRYGKRFGFDEHNKAINPGATF